MYPRMNEPSVVVIGGGSGLSNMLRGLKKQTGKLTAIVTMADDGGSSGRLRSDLGMPPPGDVRNCLGALANTEPTMEKLLSYRFKEGELEGQSLGNLVLAALNDISGSFYEAVCRLSEILAITGRVLPVTTEDVRLKARFDDGTEILGESKICDFKKAGARRISSVELIPQRPKALKESIRAIEEADLIILGPGSLYTSIIPNLLTEGVAEAIENSDALKLYILNVATEDGETEGYAASDHVSAIFKHGGRKLFDYCLANNTPFPKEMADRYAADGAGQTMVDIEELEHMGVHPIIMPLLEKDAIYARHDPEVLARAVMRIYREKSPTKIYF